jgi:hypothetical protein
VFLRSLLAVLEERPADALADTARATAVAADPEALFYMARQFARLGDHGAALRNLQQAVARGFTPVRTFELDVWLAPLRTMPEFAALIEGPPGRRSAAQRTFAELRGPELLESGRQAA